MKAEFLTRARALSCLGTGLVVLGSAQSARAEAPSAVSVSVTNSTAAVTAPASDEPLPAAAPPKVSGLMTEAKQRFDRGLAFYRDGDPGLALIEFNRAYELVPNFRVLYNIGQVGIQLARYADARRALERYLREGGSALTPERIGEVDKDLSMLASRTALLLVTSEVAGAEVLIDEIVVGKVPLERALLVDAGIHRVALRMPGYDSQVSRVTLAGGDESQLAPSLVKRVVAAPMIVLRDAVKEPSSDSSLLITGWVATGVLAAGAVVTGIMGWTERKKLQELQSQDADVYPDLRDGLNDAETKGLRLFLASDVLGTAAVVTGGLSLWATLASGDNDSVEPKDKAAATTLEVGYAEGQFKLRGAF